jgi:two-component system, sensor histidine kinase LadS
MPPKLRHWLCLLLSLLFAAQAVAALVLDGEARHIDLNNALGYRSDPSGQLGIAEIAAHPEAFHPATRSELHRGFSADTHWLRLDLRNPGQTPLTRWLEVGHPRLESVRIFWQEDGIWHELATGTQVPRAAKDIVAASPLLPLTLAPGEERTLFIRVNSRTIVDMATSLWDPLTFRGQETSYFFGQGAFLASLLLAAGFALLIYLLMRDHVYLLFACALLFQVVNNASTSGVLQSFLWPARWPFVTELIACGWGLALFFHMLVLRDFLDLPRTMPFWNRIVVGLAGLALISTLFILIHDYRLWTQVIMAETVACVILAPLLSLTLLRRGFRPARFLVVGAAIFWLAVLFSMASMLSIFPAWVPTIDSLPLATVIASSLILFAVTERTRELREALAQADAAIEAKTTFLAHMSHELRTPLNTVIGFARLIRRGAPQISPSEGGNAIEKSGLHLLSMIDELLDHARADLGKLQLEPAPTSWPVFIERISETAGALGEESGNRFILETAGTVPQNLLLDARRLRQVLENLLANANRHTHHGCVKLRCQLAPSDGTGNPRLNFQLSDTGEGIAQEDQKRIFESFQRGTRQTTESGGQGYGLGLTIARQLVALMGGELRLERSSPGGSCFGFSIECTVLETGTACAAADDSSNTWQTSQTKTLLVVEDLAESKMLLRHLLEGAGFTVIEAASGRQALECLDSHIDLILTDQFISDGNGWDVLRGVRVSFPEIPVILLSAADPERPPSFPADIDFDAILGKPFDEKQLFRQLGKLLSIEWSDTGITPLSPATIVVPPADDRAILAQLAKEGRVSDIEDWIQALVAQSTAWEIYANMVRQALHRLDFEELAQLATAPTDTQ